MKLINTQIYISKKQHTILKNTNMWVINYFNSAESQNKLRFGGHGIDHSQRVTGLAFLLAIRENYDPFLVTLAAILHDVGRVLDDPRAHNNLHGRLSAEVTAPFLDSLDLLTKLEKELIINAIEDHPMLNKEVRESPLVKILMDADRLDSIGVVAPVRAGAYRWRLPLYKEMHSISAGDLEIKSIYQDFAFRVMQWEKMLWTKSAKQIAKPRFTQLRRFIKEFKNQVEFANRAYKNLKLG